MVTPASCCIPIDPSCHIGLPVVLSRLPTMCESRRRRRLPLPPARRCRATALPCPRVGFRSGGDSLVEEQSVLYRHSPPVDVSHRHQLFTNCGLLFVHTLSPNSNHRNRLLDTAIVPPIDHPPPPLSLTGHGHLN
ncbi:hypothetical protein MA16_Dca007944 [Dendrobium catenatum]|uniref:Uncharacterized protein n=1 Tax=Dendrobium catenatum TaxID=906689 RepID=A0A2I0XJB2_9ASPA|nr:hypothetical protein MA16_Dca007944 [Dendrobium catenatum]